MPARFQSSLRQWRTAPNIGRKQTLRGGPVCIALAVRRYMVPFARQKIVWRFVVVSIVRLRLNALTRASLSRAGECGVGKSSNNDARRVSWGVLDDITEGAQEIFVVLCRASCERQVCFWRDSSTFTLATGFHVRLAALGRSCTVHKERFPYPSLSCIRKNARFLRVHSFLLPPALPAC